MPQDLLHGFGRYLAVGQRRAQPVPECMQPYILHRQSQLSQQWLQSELHNVLPLARAAIPVGGVQTRIEVTPVLRGCVYEPKLLTVSRSVEETFGFAEVRVVSFADLYGGKIVAALDRQHPRDLNSPQLSVRPSD